MNILVLNSGSSSLKFQIFMESESAVKISGRVEQVGEAKGYAVLSVVDACGLAQEFSRNEAIPDHREAIRVAAELLRESGAFPDVTALAGIGHRVVHGGEVFQQPARIDHAVITEIEKLTPLAPLHNPANLAGIRVMMAHLPDVPQVAVFDTAFHHSIPEHAYLYALPYALYEKQNIRRYGFHGTSHSFVARQAARYLDTPLRKLNIISLHLGNGCSAAAIKNGVCVDTSMGFTPLEGLVMGTRSGDIDPAILFYLARESKLDIDALDTLLNKQSGLKGICGVNDMRTINDAAARGEQKSQLAQQIFCYRIKKYIGAYIAALGGVDCIVFTGGIGENSPTVRQMSCQGMERLGIHLDQQKNTGNGKYTLEIQTDNSKVKLLVIPTNEEHEIARQTRQLIKMGTELFK